ncbi:helix-turn-helix domain-containing protein [Enterococcus hirae]|jgi:transcriptional regulator with XRE-family HTH domain|nr:helix-turn-helix domain-containing protein [Enterococcaceae bacterium]MCI1918894.1 helix-turn-helix domain-containing protein [Enterococcaceae bacterium]MDM8213094.1 helix-turn-helix domain-containing protein [Enterococcus hirae]
MKTNLENLGPRIKKMRQARGYTLKDMVEYTGLSLGYLSNLERNTTSPTLAALSSICDFFNIDLTEILTEPAPQKILIKKEERRRNEYPDQLLTAEIIEYPDQEIVLEILTQQAGDHAAAPFWRHNFSEICTVISGEVVVLLEDEEYHLYAGDSLAIGADIRHAMKNPGEGTAVSQWVHRKAI